MIVKNNGSSVLHEWKKSIVEEGGKIKDVINSLNNSSSQVAIIESKQKKFVGIITDGDIRRGFLDGKAIDDEFETLINKNPIIVDEYISSDEVLKIMIKEDIHQIPIVKNNEIHGLHVIDNILTKSKHDNLIVIMAGGMGKRLRPYTEDCPKPMLKVGNKPMLQHIIEKAKEDGFNNFIITTHYLNHIIEEHFRDGSEFGVNITYTHEKDPLGTAGALSLIDPKPDKPFIVTNGDVMTEVRFSDILDFHTNNDGIATMAIRQYELHHPFGVVDIKNSEVESFEEKPIYYSYINAGVYVLNPEALSSLNKNEVCDMPTLLQKNKSKNNKITAYPMHESWIDVGREEDLHSIRREGKYNK